MKEKDLKEYEHIADSILKSMKILCLSCVAVWIIGGCYMLWLLFK